jgi:hypothetical protein
MMYGGKLKMINLVTHDKQIVLYILNKQFLWHFLEYI